MVSSALTLAQWSCSIVDHYHWESLGFTLNTILYCTVLLSLNVYSIPQPYEPSPQPSTLPQLTNLNPVVFRSRREPQELAVGGREGVRGERGGAEDAVPVQDAVGANPEPRREEGAVDEGGGPEAQGGRRRHGLQVESREVSNQRDINNIKKRRNLQQKAQCVCTRDPATEPNSMRWRT